MKSIIIGTAGHIDHGKTALVKALTGIDADRLEEEKRRGITIDLGFAHLELAGEGGELLRVGFVDVPGHERFVRNMLAGVGGIDLVLLVIAADEGIKPQTREHFDICRLLGIQHGIVVLTKADLVDHETLEVLHLEIEDYLRGSFLERAPIVAVSSLKRTGLEDLKRELVRIAERTSVRDSNANARLPIDRVFTMKGFGTVVTGTLVAGTIRKEDELQLFPSGKRVRIRGVQVHGKNESSAVAGERTALNLAAVEKHELERGMLLAMPGVFESTSRVDVKLSLLASARPLKNGSQVHFHAFASEVIATLTLYGKSRLEAGSDCFARVRLSDPLLLFPGDRFIIRQFSPVITIGGGFVLENKPSPRVRSVEKYVDHLELLTDDSPEAVLRGRVISRGTQGLTIDEVVARTGWTKAQISYLADRISEITPIDNVLVSTFALGLAKKGLLQVLDSFHRQNPLAAGISKENLRERLVGVAPAITSSVLDDAAKSKQIMLSGDLVHLSGRGVVMKDEESQSRTTIERAFASAGLKVPALKDVLAGLKIDKARAQKIVTLLLREKVLVKVSDDLVFHQNALAELRKTLVAHKARSAKIDVGGFKELAGVSRKYAIPLLEYLDRERITRREGDTRTIL
ncbi:MAG TPA: selenocysteine-specific translation elongation factor [Terriglobales bacterium]|nr:selenocysteine-specific translation elongation factor [Terriglobales bacterium]